MIIIALINASTALSDTQVSAVMPSLQIQISRDFAPAWGIDAKLIFVPTGQQPPVGSWWLTFLDNSDQAGALGYHDVTAEGLPLGKVFVKESITSGLSWSTTASHEVLEMLGDPAINLCVLNGNTLYAYEVCDSPEDDRFAYHINGVLVSDFVFPSWFETFRVAGTQFDQRKHITAPLQLLPGGYIGVYNISNGSGWQQITAKEGPIEYRMRPKIGSRRDKRRIPRSQWMLSTPTF